MTDNIEQPVTELVSELMMLANMNGEHLEFHLVSHNSDDGERFAIYVFSPATASGTVVARLEPNVPFEVAVSLFIGMSLAEPMNGTDRAYGMLAGFFDNPDQPDGLIIPDTTTVEQINK